MKRETILYIVREPVGGIWKHMELLINYFKKEYHIIIVGDLDNGDKKFKKFREKCSDIEYMNMKISRNPSTSDFTNILKIIKLLSHSRVDIIHGHGAKGGIYARVLGIFHKAKVFYTPHGGSVHDSFGTIQTLIYRFIESTMYPLTDNIVVESKYTDRQYRRTLFFKTEKQSKIVLNYNGIDCNNSFKQKEKEKINMPIIASFGMLRPEKGQDILILAAKELIGRGLKVEVNIFGEGTHREYYEGLIVKNSLEEYVFLKGETDNVEYEMSKSDIIVQPSRFESFGYVLLEAMCAGVPVIASNVGGMREILEHDKNGRLFEKGDSIDLANQILFLLKNKEKKEQYIEEGKRTVLKKFSAEKMCNGLDKIYESFFKS